MKEVNKLQHAQVGFQYMCNEQPIMFDYTDRHLNWAVKMTSRYTYTEQYKHEVEEWI